MIFYIVLKLIFFLWNKETGKVFLEDIYTHKIIILYETAIVKCQLLWSLHIQQHFANTPDMKRKPVFVLF